MALPVLRRRGFGFGARQLLLEIEVGPARFARIPAPLAALSLDVAQSLVGREITVTAATKRPRNRWLYALSAGGAELVTIDAERARDATARASNVRWMLGNGLIAALIFTLALRRRAA